MTPDDELERTEIEAALDTRRELGPRYDRELVEGFADRIEAEVRRRAGDELRTRGQAQGDRESGGKRQLALGIVSICGGIPITAISGAMGEVPGMVVAWLGIAAVNAAHAAAVNGSRRKD